MKTSQADIKEHIEGAMQMCMQMYRKVRVPSHNQETSPEEDKNTPKKVSFYIAENEHKKSLISRQNRKRANQRYSLCMQMC